MKAFVKGTTISRVKDTPIGRGHVPRTAERPQGSWSIAHITRVSVSQLLAARSTSLRATKLFV